MLVRVDWYKQSGKWYAGGKVEIGDAPLHDKEAFMQAIVNGQHELVDSWTSHAEFTVVVSPVNDDAERFVNALFPAHEWAGMKRPVNRDAPDEVSGEKILDLTLEANGANAKNIRQYFKALLRELLNEREDFSGKRPFGNSGWTSDLELPLVKGGLVMGTFDKQGNLLDCDSEVAAILLRTAVDAL